MKPFEYLKKQDLENIKKNIRHYITIIPNVEKEHEGKKYPSYIVQINKKHVNFIFTMETPPNRCDLILTSKPINIIKENLEDKEAIIDFVNNGLENKIIAHKQFNIFKEDFKKIRLKISREDEPSLSEIIKHFI